MPPSDPRAPPPPQPGAQLSALYQELILDHYRRPRHKGPLEGADVSVTVRNPLCGDEMALHLAFDGDRVREAKWVGQGCAISMASASMMAQTATGKSVEELTALGTQFARMIHGTAEAAAELGELRALSGVAKLPARVRCALLAWNALEQGLGKRAGDR